MSPLVRALEATLFAATQPMSVEGIARHLGQGEWPVRDALRELAQHYAGRGFHWSNAAALAFSDRA
jgi:segregation and condensation protein B